jgi:hypothetical protein
MSESQHPVAPAPTGGPAGPGPLDVVSAAYGLRAGLGQADALEQALRAFGVRP